MNFNLLPCNCSWLIYADYLEEQGNFTCYAYRNGFYFIENNDDNINNVDEGSGEGDGDGEGSGNGWGEGHGNVWGDGEGSGLGDGYGGGKGSNNGPRIQYNGD